MNKRVLSVVSLMLFSSPVFAANDDSGFFVGAEGQFVTTDDKVNDENLTSSGIGLNVGYYFNHYIGLEAGYGVTDDLIYDDSFEHYDFLVLGRLPLSDKFNVQLGGGTAVYNNEALSKGKIGLSYQISRQFSWNAGYSFYGKPDDWDEHIESFDMGFTYYFGQKESVQPRVAVVPTQVNPIETSKLQPKPVVKKKTVCQTQLVTELYRVKAGEWLRKIAGDHDMSWSYFLKVNEEFMHHTLNIDLIHPGELLEINLSKELCE